MSFEKVVDVVVVVVVVDVVVVVVVDVVVVVIDVVVWEGWYVAAWFTIVFKFA